MMPVERGSTPGMTESGLFDIGTLASLEKPESEVQARAVDPAVDQFEMPQFTGLALMSVPVELPKAAPKMPPPAPTPAPVPTSNTRPLWFLAAVATVATVVLGVVVI